LVQGLVQGLVQVLVQVLVNILAVYSAGRIVVRRSGSEQVWLKTGLAQKAALPFEA